MKRAQTENARAHLVKAGIKAENIHTAVDAVRRISI